jgi:7-carboxy-7-deazaguanine synthase
MLNEYRLPVNEVFASMQGEGTFTGMPCAFIRLQGCPVGCPWCDTKYTWERKDNRRMPLNTILLKTKGMETDEWCWMTLATLAGILSSERTEHVVVTGGEPCLHDLVPLGDFLERGGYRMQVETSGTVPIRVTNGTFVTVSPKIDMPGGLTLLTESLARADEIKFPVGRDRDVERLERLVLPHAKVEKHRVFLQPISQNEKATALCIRAARAKGWRVSVQVHKFVGVR